MMPIINEPLHPGEIVKDELIEGAGLSVSEAANKLGISRTALSRLLNGHASISPEMALRLSKLFNTSIEMWINIQAQYDTWRISKLAKRIKVKPLNLDKAA
jgi:addiction module HigA family antidote